MMDWEPEVPERLFDICFNYCVNYPRVFCERHGGKYKLRDGIFLPHQICEQLVATFRDNRNIDTFISLFTDTTKSKLNTLNLRDALQTTTEDTLCALFKHNLSHLDIVGCSSVHTPATLNALNSHGHNLRSLCVSGHGLFDSLPVSVDDEGVGDVSSDGFGVDFIFDCPKLKALALHEVHETNCCAKEVITVALKPLTLLSHLDLSGCEIEFESMTCIGDLNSLLVLVLYNVPIKNINLAFSIIAKLTNLKALDLSQGHENAVAYQDSDDSLGYLMQHLLKLTDLDISGTNLAGFLKKEKEAHSLQQDMKSRNVEDKCAIPGLENNRLKFLGLLGCSHEASARSNIPADRVAGEATEEQVILAVQKYLEKTDLLVTGLNFLFHKFRYSECVDQRGALEGILNAMKRWPYEKHVQICGSASLFYVVKGEKRYHFNTKLKRRIIKAVIEGMSNHMDESTMMRNGSLTLCHFSIPKDVKFVYRKLVTILLKMVASPSSEEFVQRIGIYLLNSLACQVDGNEKKMVGDLGAISTMLDIIRHKLARAVCDEVMEIAWSTMWNVTDETALNCERFINEGGMDLFLSCLSKFPNKDELLRNMMGLLGNVAEVPELRCKLMVPAYVSVFSELLESESDGIEVSYNACGVLSHMVFDGEEAWTVTEPSRTDVLSCMDVAISRWSLKTKRNINYRSFEPILRLVPKFDTPQCQHWAIWALCNLTKMYRSKYCPLLEKENGLALLEQVVQYDYPYQYQNIQELAQSVLDRCTKFKEDGLDDYSDDDENNMQVDPAVLEG